MTRARLVAVAALAWLGACQLPPSSQVLYKCDPGNACPADQACWPDGYCHPSSDGTPPTTDAGRDAGFDAGVVDSGTPDAGADAGDDAGVDAGTDAGDDAGTDAGDDAGTDAGFDAGVCVPVSACPSSATCGTFDAGCGTTLECSLCTAPEECGAQVANECGLPKLCPSGFCWENPLPQGNTLFGAWAAGPRTVWLVGENGTLLLWNGERTQLVDLGTTADLRAVHGSGPNDVYVVGEVGTVFHFNGAVWQRETTPGTYRINAVWVAPGGATVFAAANGGFLLKRTSGTWTEMALNPSSTADFVAIAGLDTGEVYASSVTRVYRLASLAANSWQGDTTWQTPNRDTMAMASLGNQLLAGGRQAGMNVGHLFERQADGGWKQVGPNIPSAFSSIAITSSGPWLGLFNGSAATFTSDAGLVTIPLSRDAGLLGVGVVSPSGVLAVGEYGTEALVEYDAGVRELSWGATTMVNGFCGYSDNRAYAPANGVTVFERRPGVSGGARWDPINRPAMTVQKWLTCFADGPDKVWIAGDDRWILRQSGGVFVQDDTALNTNWVGIWGSPNGPWHFANSNSTIYSTMNGQMPTFTAGAPAVTQGLWGVASDDVLAVGSGGGVNQRNSTIWFSVVTPQAGRNLRAVHGQKFTDGGVLYSIVGSATGWRRVNGNFVADAFDAGHTLRGTWVSPAGDVWAAGEDGGGTTLGRGVVWKLDTDAGMWIPLTSPTTRPLNAMGGYLDVGPYVTGGGGAILRHLGTDGG